MRVSGFGMPHTAEVAEPWAPAHQGSRARRRGKTFYSIDRVHLTQRRAGSTGLIRSRASAETWRGGRRHTRFTAGELCGGYFLLPTFYSYFRFYCGAVSGVYAGWGLPLRGGRHRGTTSTATMRALATICSATVSGLFFRLRPLRFCSSSCVCRGLTCVSSAPQAPGPDFGRTSDGFAPDGWCRGFARVRLRLARARPPSPDWVVRRPR